MRNSIRAIEQDSVATRVGVGMYFAFVPMLLLYDYFIGLGNETVRVFYGYVPAVLVYDFVIRAGLNLESISEWFWTHRRWRTLACVYAAAGGIVLVASTPQWPIGSSVYAIVASGLLIAHLGFEFLPGLRNIL